MWWRDGVRPGDFVLLYGGLNCRDWHPALIGEDIGMRMVGGFFYPHDGLGAVNPEPDIALAMRFEAQGIHMNWINLGIHGFRWFVQRMEREGKNLRRDYFPELKCVDQTGELSKSLVDYAANELFDVPITSHYAPPETFFFAGSCGYGWKEGEGSRMYNHYPEDTFFLEVFPPSSDKAVDGAEFGEVVFTNLFIQAMAYVRWRSEDWSDIKYDPCSYCGYTHMQGRIMGRVSESVNVNGKTVTMGDIEDVLYAHPETRPMPAQLIREEPQPQDKLRLRVSYKTDLVKEPEQFRLKLEGDFKRQLGVDTAITLITPEEVRAIAHKYERVTKEKRQS